MGTIHSGNKCEPLSFINNTFLSAEIDVTLRYATEEDRTKLTQINSFCSIPLEFEHNKHNIIIQNSAEIIAFFSISITGTQQTCCYIGYRCTHANFTRLGWAEFMAFAIMLFAVFMRCKYIFAIGVSDMPMVQTEHMRMDSTRNITVSQKILADKFSFEDAYKGEYDTKSQEFFKQFVGICEEAPESYMDLILGNMIKYEQYKYKFQHEARTLFDKYLEGR